MPRPTADSPSTGAAAAARAARVTRLSRKVLTVLGAVAGLGIGGPLLFALRSGEGEAPAELYATETSRRQLA